MHLSSNEMSEGLENSVSQSFNIKSITLFFSSLDRREKNIK
jgi:hypothetical protein